jgi:hypothetical protein
MRSPATTNSWSPGSSYGRPRDGATELGAGKGSSDPLRIVSLHLGRRNRMRVQTARASGRVPSQWADHADRGADAGAAERGAGGVLASSVHKVNVELYVDGATDRDEAFGILRDVVERTLREADGTLVAYRVLSTWPCDPVTPLPAPSGGTVELRPFATLAAAMECLHSLHSALVIVGSSEKVNPQPGTLASYWEGTAEGLRSLFQRLQVLLPAAYERRGQSVVRARAAARHTGQ